MQQNRGSQYRGKSTQFRDRTNTIQGQKHKTMHGHITIQTTQGQNTTQCNTQNATQYRYTKYINTIQGRNIHNTLIDNNKRHDQNTR